MKQTGLVLFMILFLPLVSRAQDAQFSQYYAAGLYVNPAMAGVTNSITFGANYRRQGNSLEFPYEISQVTAIMPFQRGASEKYNVGGVGASFFNERAGINQQFQTNGFYFTGAYNIDLNFDHSEVIVLAVQGGYIQRSVDYSGYQWGSQYNRFVGFDENLPTGIGGLNDQVSYPVINAGVLYYFNPKRSAILYSGSAFSGISVSNVNQPNTSVFQDDDTAPVPLLLKYHGGMEFFLNNRMRVAPQILALYQASNLQFNGGMYLTYNLSGGGPLDDKRMEMLFGLWHRWKDSFIFSTGFNANNYAIGFSYDLNTSVFRYQTRGAGSSFELSLSFRINSNQGLRNYNTPLI